MELGGEQLRRVMCQSSSLAIGLMSGTSADGVDAALVRIDGCGTDTKVKQLAFVSVPFEPQVRQCILETARGTAGGSGQISRLNALLGVLYLEACGRVCECAGVSFSEIDFVGSHGQTVWHQPEKEWFLGREITSTLQIGDPSVLCEKMGTIVVSDFRVRDMAAGGQGAPLVPYTEYLLYRSETQDTALQNIGGIGNVTWLPRNAQLSDVLAFDTGPGNMIMDAVTERLTGGVCTFDRDGALAASYPVCGALLDFLMEEPYLRKAPPKTTGRERYNEKFIARLYGKGEELGLSLGEVLATVTAYTAKTIAWSVQEYLPQIPDRLIVGGGGSRNLTLLSHLRQMLPGTEILTNEAIGFDSDAKEAVAFAVLANETLHGLSNNAPGATGAAHPVIMGKISQ